ncbi:putative nuclease HARBI1 isoform X2 [Tanacetum coccineum]
MSSEYERYVNSDFVTHLHPKDFASFDVLGFWKENETMFPVLSRMTMDIISVQASSVAFESLLQDHLDAKERKQDKCPLETPLDFEEGVFDDERQESAQKDVERAFAVLQGRWGLIQQPACEYEVNTLRRIMYAGIIMHYMILEDQNMSVVDWKHVYSNPARLLQTVWIDRCQTQRRKAKELRDKDTHISLQQNLMNHIWREVEEASKED